MADTNGRNGHQPASFLRDIVALRDGQRVDPAASIPGMPPNFGRYPVRHVGTFQTFMTSIANVYRDYDEALKHSLDNARYMRNDCGIMECLEARQRATSLLNWHIEPEDDKSQDQKALCEVLTKILERIPRFTEYRLNLLHALWYGKYAIQHRYGWQSIGGRRYVMPTRERENQGWLPINGDKIVFRFDTKNLKDNQYAHQVGIRIGLGNYQPDEIASRMERANPIEATDRGMAYFLTDAERKLLAIHKHSIEDGAFEDAMSAGMIHGVGIRSRIYWDWFQKQESLGFLIEYLERSAGGIELWQYPQGNPKAKEEMEQAATEHVGGKRNVLLVPVPPGEEGLQYGVQIIEPGLAGIDVIKDLLANYYGHRIKRYILGQVLSSEAESTGLGSGVADLHMETFQQIIHYDAGNLEETITNDLLEPIKRWNFPQASGINLRFKIDTEKTDQDQRLKAFESAWSMGARIKEADVLEVIGAAVPTPDERVLTNPQIEQAKAQTQAMQMQQQQMQQQMGMGRSQASVLANIAPDPQRDAAKLSQLLGVQPPAAGAGAGAMAGMQPGQPPAGGDGAAAATGPDQYRRTGDPARYSYVTRDPDLRAAIARAADETEREPSDAAKSAGNYRKGKFAFHGMEIAIETPQGATRSGKNKLGVSWEVTMPAHYGYIRRTASEADGMHVDCFIGPTPESEIVYIVDQQTDGGRFDEHKCMLGFRTMAEARQAYLDAYSTGWKGLREITPIAMPQFKNWLDHGDTSKAFAGQVSKYARTWAENGNIKFDWREDGPDGGAEAGGTAGDSKPEPKGENCGTGAGGFQSGNTCAGGGEGRGEKPATKDRVKVSAKNLGGRWYATADLPDGKMVTRSDADQAKAVQLAHQDIRDAGFEPHVPEDERADNAPLTRGQDADNAQDATAAESGKQLFDGKNAETAPPPLQPTLPGASAPQTTLRKGKHAALVGATVMHVGNLKADPSRFQYKIAGIDPKTGVTRELKDVGAWNPILAGIVTVWHDPADGQTYVINGHHRWELAQRAIGKPLSELLPGMQHDPQFDDGNGNYNGALQVQYLDAADAKSARAMGALANIAEGRGTAIDAAKFMRDTGTTPEMMKQYGVSLKGAVAQNGATLRGLSDNLFDRLTTGRMTEGRALAIAQHLPDRDRQDELFSRISKAEEKRDLSDATVAEMAREMGRAGSKQTSGGLFGGFFNESTFAERAELKAHLRRALSSEARAFKEASSERRQSTLQSTGTNVIDVEGNRGRAQSASEAVYDFDTRVNASGDPLAEAVDQAAEQFANASNERDRNAVKRQLTEAARRILGGQPGDQLEERDGGSQPTPAGGGSGSLSRTPGGLAAVAADREQFSRLGSLIREAQDQYGLSRREARAVYRRVRRMLNQ